MGDSLSDLQLIQEHCVELFSCMYNFIIVIIYY